MYKIQICDVADVPDGRFSDGICPLSFWQDDEWTFDGERYATVADAQKAIDIRGSSLDMYRVVSISEPETVYI